MSELCKAHFIVAKRILRYTKAQKNYSLLYKTEKDSRLARCTESDWGRCKDDRKSTSKYVFQLGLKAILWSSKKKATRALSSIKTKYIIVISAACKALWFRRILDDLI